MSLLEKDRGTVYTIDDPTLDEREDEAIVVKTVTETGEPYFIEYKDIFKGGKYTFLSDDKCKEDCVKKLHILLKTECYPLIRHIIEVLMEEGYSKSLIYEVICEEIQNKSVSILK